MLISVETHVPGIMGDLREILGIQAPKATTGPVMPGSKSKTAQGPPPMEPRAKKPRLSREVMSLKASIRGTVPGMMPTLIPDTEDGQKKFKQKIKLGTKRVGKWEKRAFKNAARSDGALFLHWRPAKQLEESYKFAKFNRKLSIPKYTDAEYNTHFVVDTWTREETDYLFDMLNAWDLRFILVADRWQPPPDSIKSTRTVEELKDRYYTIQRGLLPLRKHPADEDLASNIMMVHRYDPLREAERKRQQNESTHRTEEDIALENEITTECARIDATFKRHNEDALKYLRLIKKQQKYYANLKIERQAYQAAKELDERAKMSKRAHPAPGSTPNPNGTGMNVDLATSSSTSAPPTSAPLTASGQIKLTRRHPAIFSRTHNKPYTQPLVPLLNQQKYASLYAKAMPELGVDSVPRSSFVLVSAVTELRCDLLLLHEMQRLVAEKTYEIEVLKTLHKTLQDRLKGTPARSVSTRSTPASSTMDVDS